MVDTSETKIKKNKVKLEVFLGSTVQYAKVSQKCILDAIQLSNLSSTT